MNQTVVTGVLVFKGSHLLLVKKPPNVGPYPGQYLTPGGGVHIGEPIDDAVKRELYEETGVKVTNLQRIVFDDVVTDNWKGVKTHFIMLLYTGEYISGELKPTAGDDDNLTEIEWFSPDHIDQMSLSPPLRKLLKHLAII